jgi:hypothetical protein
MAVTDGAGNYLHQVPAGRYLVAFFVPVGGATSPESCGGNDSQIDLSIQPEWYRNVPVRFSDPSDPHSEPVIPSMSDVTIVDVRAADVDGIDACLGTETDAGADAPCPDPPEAVAAAQPDAAPTTTSTAPSTPRSSAATPKQLAFTGTNLSGVWLGLGLVLGGAVMAAVAARRPRRRRAPA